MCVQGPMARHVHDLRLALEIMSRASHRDPWHVPAPVSGPSPKPPVRVAVVRDPAALGVDPSIAFGVDTAARALAGAGYAVEELEPPSVGQAAELWAQLISVDNRALLPLMEPVMSEGGRCFLTLAAGMLPNLDMAAYSMAFMARQGLLRAWSEFLDRYTLMLAPICTAPPFRVGSDLSTEGITALLHDMRMVVAVNLLGLPAVAVPVGVAEGLPQAVQVIGARYREDLCLDAAEAIENHVGTITPIDPR
jgi:amidase